MFTGLIQAVGHLAQIESLGADCRLRIDTGALDVSDAGIGDSIAVNGVCLTAVQWLADGFWTDVSAETLSCTTLGGLRTGARVNLETALLPSTRLGGHLVSGHVDGIGQILACEQDARSLRLSLKVPDELARYVAAKGSICMDGVSLTVNAVQGAVCGLNIVPHTLEQTIITEYAVGTKVNLEADIIARYLERLLLGEAAAKTPQISREFLAQHGFIHGTD